MKPKNRMNIPRSVLRPMRGVALSRNTDKWPFLASPKIDGMRAVVRDGVVLSKTLKPIPNENVQRMFGHLHGADGELTVGNPRIMRPGDDVFGRSRGPIMSQDQEAGFRFTIFDRWDLDDLPAIQRARTPLTTIAMTEGAVWLDHVIVNNEVELAVVYKRCVDMGFEGVMLRHIHGLYKYGQSTEREGLLLKVKPFRDSEAEVLGVYEQMKNTNVATVGSDGRTVRSSSKSGKVGKNTLGGFHVRDIYTGVEFDIGGGAGITAKMRKILWKERDKLPGLIMTYQYQEVGTKDKPRIPQFKNWRDKIDISMYMEGADHDEN